jgi:CRP-like cAMP-binding protein
MDRPGIKSPSFQKAIYEKNGDVSPAKYFEKSQERSEKSDIHTIESMRELLLYLDLEPFSDTGIPRQVIRNQSCRPISEGVIANWYDLYNQLTTEEFYCIFEALEDWTYCPGQLVYRQGEKNDNLYFIHRGHLKVICNCRCRKILIKTITGGQIAGEDSFFTTTVNNASLVALSEVILGVLKKESLDRVRNDFPSLEQKLHDYVKRYKSVGELVRERQLERRSGERRSFSGQGVVSLFGPSGEWSRKGFYATFSDISCGGLAFLVRIPRREAARELLGQKLRIFPRITPDGNLGLDLTGTVVSVSFLTLHDCSVHVKFNKSLSVAELNEIVDSYI